MTTLLCQRDDCLCQVVEDTDVCEAGHQQDMAQHVDDQLPAEDDFDARLAFTQQGRNPDAAYDAHVEGLRDDLSAYSTQRLCTARRCYCGQCAG